MNNFPDFNRADSVLGFTCMKCKFRLVEKWSSSLFGKLVNSNTEVSCGSSVNNKHISRKILKYVCYRLWFVGYL